MAKSESGRHDEAPLDFINHVQDALVDAALGTDSPDDLSKARERFGITDRGSAAWAAGKLAEAQAEIERRKKQADEYVRDAERRLDRLKWLFWEPLREWARRNLDSGRRSVKLPTATLKFRDLPARLEVVDEETAKKWAIVELPDAIVSVERLMMEPLKDYWNENKVVPPGLKELPPSESFNVT